MKPTKRQFVGLLAFLLCLCCADLLFAQYTLVLKNGRRITVQSYREEGGMVKFSGFGGEIGIAKDQIQTIVKAGEGTAQGTVFPPTAGPGAPAPLEGARRTPDAMGREPAPGKAKTPEEQLAEERAKEEKEYQKRVEQITQQLREARERYSLLTRGRGGPEPSILETGEAMKGRADDLNSRLRDVQHSAGVPGDAGGVRLSTPSPFSGVPPDEILLTPQAAPPSVNPPPPSYSEREKELSDLRNRMARLERERDQMIQEMKQKNFDTGSLFLE
jgi:hypothetical protein